MNILLKEYKEKKNLVFQLTFQKYHGEPNHAGRGQHFKGGALGSVKSNGHLGLSACMD